MRLVVMMMPGFSFSHRMGDLEKAYWVPTGTAVFFSRFTGVVVKQIRLFYKETPSHGPIPPPKVNMARWPKTTSGLERFIGAESVRTIRHERELLFYDVYSRCIYRAR